MTTRATILVTLALLLGPGLPPTAAQDGATREKQILDEIGRSL
jgi:hypothetical protein